MTKIQLYIEGKRVDMFDRETIEVKQYIKDLKEVGKLFADYSKPFNVPASESNNKIFKHFYNYKITDGFDARVRRSAEIQLNYQEFKKGHIFLEGVDLRNNIPHTYRLKFFGSTTSLKDKFGDDTLASLNLSDFNHDYNYSTIKDIFKGSGFTGHSDGPGYIVNGDNDALIYPLITPKKRLFYDSTLADNDPTNYDGNIYDRGSAVHHRGLNQEDLKPAIKAYYIIKAIEAKYDIVMIPDDDAGTDDFFSRYNDAFSNLYFWLSNSAGNIAGKEDEEGYFYKQELVNFTVTTDSDETIPWFFTDGKTFTITAQFTDYVKENGGNSRRGYVFKIDVDTDSANEEKNWLVQLVDASDNEPVASKKGKGDFTWEIDLPSAKTSRQFYIKFSSEQAITSGVTVTFRAVNRKNVARGVLSESREGYKSFVDTSSNQQFDPNAYASDMKIIDFISGLVKMFNLVAYYIDDQSDSEYGEDSNGVPNVLKFLTTDRFYKNAVDNISGGIIDITEFVDVSAHSVNTLLPYSEISFRYQDNDTVIRNNHTFISNGKIFGNSELPLYKLNQKQNVYFGEKYEVELPFTILKYEHILDEDDDETGIQWGYAAGGDFQVTEGDLTASPVQPNKGDYTPENLKPLLFYGIKTTLSGSYSIKFKDAGALQSEAVTTYFRPSNSNETIVVDSDGEYDTPADYQLTFDSEMEEYSNYESINSLFKVFYEDYLLSIFDETKRLHVISAYLPPRILTGLKLNDQLKIHDTIYRINSIVTSLRTGKSKLELVNLSADEVVGTQIIARNIFIN